MREPLPFHDPAKRRGIRVGTGSSYYGSALAEHLARPEPPDSLLTVLLDRWSRVWPYVVVWACIVFASAVVAMYLTGVTP